MRTGRFAPQLEQARTSGTQPVCNRFPTGLREPPIGYQWTGKNLSELTELFATGYITKNVDYNVLFTAWSRVIPISPSQKSGSPPRNVKWPTFPSKCANWSAAVPHDTLVAAITIFGWVKGGDTFGHEKFRNHRLWHKLVPATLPASAKKCLPGKFTRPVQGPATHQPSSLATTKSINSWISR